MGMSRAGALLVVAATATAQDRLIDACGELTSTLPATSQVLGISC